MEKNYVELDELLNKWMKDPVFAKEYRQFGQVISIHQKLMRSFDEERERLGLSKAALARKMGIEPSAVRRLFSQAMQNPTLTRVIELADAMDLELVLVSRKEAAKLKKKTEV